MNSQERARAMRASGKSFARIANELGLSECYIRNFASDVDCVPNETDKTVVRYGARNGGCSSLSGLHAVSMPRITALHGACGRRGMAVAA